MTLNVGSLFEPEWEMRRHEVVAQIVQEEPDVVCMQELWQQSPGDGTGEWLRDELASAGHEYHFVFGGHNCDLLNGGNPGFRFGSGVLSRWPIDATNCWSLPAIEDPDDPLPAAMPWELVHARTAGLDIFTTHLAPAPTHGLHRRLQVGEIDTLIRSVRGNLDRQDRGGSKRQAMPPILTGDFNAEPDSDEIRFLRGFTPLDGRTTFYQDAWAIGGDGSLGYTNDWHTHPLAGSLNVHRKRIDYIFVGDPFRRHADAGRIVSCRRVATEPITGIQASDHAGLIAEIVWPARPEA